MRFSKREWKRVAYFSIAWTVLVVAISLFQEDVLRTLALGLIQQAILTGLALLVWFLAHRRRSSSDDMRKP